MFVLLSLRIQFPILVTCNHEEARQSSLTWQGSEQSLIHPICEVCGSTSLLCSFLSISTLTVLLSFLRSPVLTLTWNSNHMNILRLQSGPTFTSQMRTQPGDKAETPWALPLLLHDLMQVCFRFITCNTEILCRNSAKIKLSSAQKVL